MAYTALYRKFRPDSFADVKGQDAVITTLGNQILSGRIGHAYLFCGTRGCGKTSVAKIMARAVNCEHPTENGPCGECPTCKAIAAGTSMNVIEIDAASNNGVDNVREIREEVTYAPTEGRYKVYIIDEVHMLSGSAFNALLKTLEEPPSYVIFILATTEPHKLPATILSRCQRYDFKRIPLDTIAERLREVVDAEGIEAEEEALRYIAKTADGAMRDALSILDQCVAFYLGEKLTYEKVLESLGAVDTAVYAKLFHAICDRNVEEALTVLEDTIAAGRDLPQFINDFNWHIRNLLMAGATTGDGPVPGMEGEDPKVLREEAKGIPGSQLIRYIRVLSELGNSLKFSAQKRILAEIGIIRLCRPEMETDTESLAQRITALEQKMESGGMDPQAFSQPMQQFVSRSVKQYMEEASLGMPEGRIAQPAAAPVKKPAPTLPMAVPADVEEVVRDFRNLIRDAEPLLKSMCEKARLSLSRNGNLLMVWPARDRSVDYVERKKEQLEALISEKTGKKIHIECEELPEKETFQNLFVDLEQKINIPIIIEEEE